MTDERHFNPKHALLAVAAALLLVIVVFAGGITATASLQPGCESCHLKEPAFTEATKGTAHAKAEVGCASCHVEPGAAGRTKFATYQVLGMYVPLLDASESDATLVKDVSCLSCHAQVNDGTTESRGLRIAHFYCAQGRSCVDCHSEVGHAEETKWARASSMNDCVACHRERSAPLQCETCHTGDVEIERSSKPEFAVTHGPNWQETHGMGEMSSCSSCHQPGSCVKCHGPGVPHDEGFGKEHASVSQLPDANCMTCHEKATFCDSCHIVEMPHPREFVVSHSDIVEAEGEAGCMRCHAVEDCDTCHVTHVHPGGAVGNIPSPDRGDR